MSISAFVQLKRFIMTYFLFSCPSDHKSQKSLLVKQSKSVHLNGSMSLQCSLHFKNKETGDTCPAEHDVYWFRVGSGESHPSMIYTPSHSSHEDEKRCFYSLSKTVNVSDKGTYYCAVDTCGQIVFGEGITLQPSKGNILKFFVFFCNDAGCFSRAEHY